MTSDDDQKTPRDAARFETEVPASPARVRALAQMVEEGLTGVLGRPPQDHEFTLIVKNRSMKATLRGYTEEAVNAGRTLERIARDPTQARRVPAERRGQVARALRSGFERFKDTGLVVEDGHKVHKTRVDTVLISALRGIEAQPVEPRTLRGITDVLTPILGVSRHVEGPQRLFAALRVESRLADFPLGSDVADLAFEAIKRGCHVRATVNAVWEASDGEQFVIVPAKSVVVQLVLVDELLEGAELLAALAEFVDPDAADAAARSAYEDRDLDWQEVR